MALSIPYLRGVTVSTCEDYWLTCTCETNEAVWNRSGDKSMFFETSFRSKDSQPFYVIGLYSHLKLSQWPVRDRAAVFIYVIVRSCSFNRTVFAAEWYCVSSCWACWIDPRYEEHFASNQSFWKLRRKELNFQSLHILLLKLIVYCSNLLLPSCRRLLRK